VKKTKDLFALEFDSICHIWASDLVRSLNPKSTNVERLTLVHAIQTYFL